MRVKLRYVTARPSAARPKRWYWQRKGFPLTRLPDNPSERWAEAERLNESADGRPAPDAEEGTINWCIQRYKLSPRYTERAESTRRIYDRWCNELAALWGAKPIRSLSRRLVVDLADSMADQKSSRHQAIAVLSAIFEAAQRSGLDIANQCHKLRLSTGRARKAYWTDADVDKMLAVCDARMRLTFMLLLYTAQRPGDVLALTWNQWNGDTIKLRQQKTGALVEIPCHAALRAELAAADKSSVQIVTWPGDTRSRYNKFNYGFASCLRRAGITHLQARDLRRTAVVRMAEHGVEVPQIAAITGHSVNGAKTVLEVYYTPTLPMAQEAIRKWEEGEQKQRDKSNAPPIKSNADTRKPLKLNEDDDSQP